MRLRGLSSASALVSTLLISVLLLIVHLPSSAAVLKDDAYEVDWHIPLIGLALPGSTFFAHPSPENKASLIYTITARAILAALNPKDGEIVWRHQLVEDPQVAGRLTPGAGIVVAAIGKDVSAFEMSAGKLVWENSLEKEVTDVKVTASNNAVVLLEDGTVVFLESQTGDVLWKRKLSMGEGLPHSLLVDENSVTAVWLAPLQKLHFTQINFADWSVGGATQSIDVSIMDPMEIIVGGQAMAWMDRNAGKLMLLPLGQKMLTPLPADLPPQTFDIELKANGEHLVLYYRTQDHKSWADVFRLVDGQKLKKLYQTEERNGYEAIGGTLSLTSSAGKDYVVWTLSTGETIVYDTQSAEAVARFPAGEKPLPRSELANAISEVIAKADETYSVRTFVTSSTPEFVGNQYLIRNGEASWFRRESLSFLEASTWVELLDPATEEIVDELDVETHQSIGAAYIHRVTRHLNELKTYGPAWAQALPKRIMAAFLNKDVTEERTGKWRDFFGFRKLAVVVTINGGIMALDIGRKGEMVWDGTLAVPNTPYEGVSSVFVPRKGVVGALTNSGVYTEFDAFNGTFLGAQKLPAQVSSSLVAETEKGEKIAVVHLSMLDRYVIVPPEANVSRPIHTVVRSKDETGLEGVLVSTSKTVEKTWTFTPPKDEKITSFIGRPLHDPVASIGKVLGDRSVLYKYLNPHLLAITTVNERLSTASVYLIDSVSGAILHTATHTAVDTSIPITLTVSENWIVYSYFADSDVAPTEDAAKGYHLVVSELYESEVKNDRGPLGNSKNASSFDAANPKPHVISQSYMFPARITSFAVTSTKQGITSREVLAITQNGIYAIPKRVLDPRRPVGRDPNEFEKEEGLFPYAPVIDIDPRSVITHERQVVGLKKVETTPSQLESTSLVFAYGVDLFGTRVSPSMQFDLLGRKFGKVQLVVTVVGLVVGAVVVAPMVRKRQINARWAN